MAKAEITAKRKPPQCSKCNRVDHNMRTCTFTRRANGTVTKPTTAKENTATENKRLNLCCPTCGKSAGVDEVVVDWAEVKANSEQ